LVKHGVKVNPSKEILPPGKPISSEKMDEFMKTIEMLKQKIVID
jgi:hypothetical protein